MGKTFDTALGGRVVDELAVTIQKNKDYLSEVDGATADGDHGVNMNKGFTKCREQLEGRVDAVGFAEATGTLGDILLSEIGGSMGPLYGSFFLEISAYLEGKAGLDARGFAEMLRAGLGGITALVPTKLGDKTLLDVLIPSIEAYEANIAAGMDFEPALLAFEDTARETCEATRDMVAKVGRASRLGERSRGFLDAGAVSCSLILTSFAFSIRKAVAGDQ